MTHGNGKDDLTPTEAMRGLRSPIDLRMKAQLVEEYERHQAANDANLNLLRSVVIK